MRSYHHTAATIFGGYALAFNVCGWMNPGFFIPGAVCLTVAAWTRALAPREGFGG